MRNTTLDSGGVFLPGFKAIFIKVGGRECDIHDIPARWGALLCTNASVELIEMVK